MRFFPFEVVALGALGHAASLMTAADKARMNDPYFGDYYDSLKARGKHHYVAVSGCARKLCGVILAVLRERRPYEPRPRCNRSRSGGIWAELRQKTDETLQPRSPPGNVSACPKTHDMRILYPIFDCQSPI